MPTPLLFSIVESPGHPNFSALYHRLGMEEVRLASQRKAMQALKQRRPDWVVAEFFYGFGNNYAGANISNLDVFLASLRKFAPAARVIVLVDKHQRRYLGALEERFPIHAVLVQPVTEHALRPVLENDEAR